MALENLRDVKKLGGFRVVHLDGEETEDDALSKDRFILINHQLNIIQFNIQKGPIKETGVNGCQIDCLIAAVGEVLAELQDGKFACAENGQALNALRLAQFCLNARTERRTREQTEGTNQERDDA